MMIKYADFYLIKAEIETIERYMHDALWKMAEIYVIFPIFTISNTISRYELFHKSCISRETSCKPLHKVRYGLYWGFYYGF